MRKNNREEILWDKRVLDYKRPLDYALMMEYINLFSERYPFLSVNIMGESIMGRSIPMITLGEGEGAVMYIGAHHGMEWITSILLLRFINEYCELYKERRRIYSYDLRYIFSTKTVYIIPMLNPDGVDYQINGVSEDNVIYDRLLKMNDNSTDFSRWQANGRGVDLNHNYNYGFFEYKKLEAQAGIADGAPTRFSGNMPESEPEVASLCNFLRFNENVKMLLTFHTQGEEIFYSEGKGSAERAKRIAGVLSRISGYKLSSAEGMAAYCGLSDWSNQVLGRPSFTVECGKGKNPLPLTDNFKLYADIREMLFAFPTFI